MDMWELKLSQKEKTKSSFLSWSASASGPVASPSPVPWDALGCPRFGVLISTRGEMPCWGLVRLSWPQWLKLMGGLISLYFFQRRNLEGSWVGLCFSSNLFCSTALFPVLLALELVACFWLWGAPITHWPCKFLSSSLVYFHIFLWRQF